ncbi:hypothetical protein ACWCPS_33245 [Streptomyces mauvecolor]
MDTELDRFAALVFHIRHSSERHRLMSASSVPTYVLDELWSACCDLDTAMWAAGLSPRFDIGASTQASPVTFRFEPPRVDGTTPARLLAQTKRFLRRHNVPARVEFCSTSYPLLILSLNNADDVRRLTDVIAAHLSGLDAVRYGLRRAALSVGVNWGSRIRPYGICPSPLPVDETYTLYTALFPQPEEAEFEPEDDEAVEEMLNAFKLALGGIGVDLRMWRGALCPHDVEFLGLSEKSASRLADALTSRANPSVPGTATPEDAA